MKHICIPRNPGEIAVSVSGKGPLVLCIPGMGESQASFRHLIPILEAAGYRVAVMDLRGHGNSTADFDAYDDQAAASDVLAIVAHLGGPATLVGSSMGAAAAVIAAAERPSAVSGLVLIGPFVRNHGNVFTRFFLQLALLRPWGPAVWRTYFAKLFGESVRSDHELHLQRAQALLKRPGRWLAFQRTARTSHEPAEAALSRVTQPTLIVMGSHDPDFAQPQAEAEWIALQTNGPANTATTSIAMIEGTGHYPMAEKPAVVAEAVLPFLAEPVHG